MTARAAGRAGVLLAALLAGACGSAPAEITPAASASASAAVPPASGRSSFVPARTVQPSTGPAASASGRAPRAPEAPAAGVAAGSPAFVPRTLILPSGRAAHVVPADTGADGSLALPQDPARVGWWTGGAAAGDPYGSVVLAGHIDSARYGVGVLAEFATARTGARVQLRAGAEQRTYRLTSVTRVAKARLAADAAVFDQSGPPRLVVITCGGAFDERTHSYADNVVIVADPVG